MKFIDGPFTLEMTPEGGTIQADNGFVFKLDLNQIPPAHVAEAVARRNAYYYGKFGGAMAARLNMAATRALEAVSALDGNPTDFRSDGVEGWVEGDRAPHHFFSSETRLSFQQGALATTPPNGVPDLLYVIALDMHYRNDLRSGSEVVKAALADLKAAILERTKRRIREGSEGKMEVVTTA